MKINKIKCDICGKIIDYNDSNNIICLGEEDQIHNICSVEFMQSLKSNRLHLRGVIKNEKDPFTVIDIEYDLCEDCLIKIRDMIINKEDLKNA